MIYSQSGLAAGSQTQIAVHSKKLRFVDLPELYLVWYHRKWFPQEKLGMQLALIYDVKLNGLEGMLRRFQR
jgi:uncharacterized protein (DUF3820 family)